jgi:hypothetical protein
MKKAFVLFAFLHFYFLSFSQKVDTTQIPRHFSGIITATNNGISLLPNFSLNKPALLFDLSLGKGRLSFDPMLRFSMEGKPWAFIFWWRYKLIKREKFTMNIGAHPSFVFRTVPTVNNGVSKDYLTTLRFFAGETTPTYFFNKHIGIGLHYLVSHGLTKDITQYTNFVAFRTIFSNIPLSNQFRMTFVPQFYYLSMDTHEGTYINGSVTLTKKNFPITFSSIISKAIKSNLGGKDPVWNVALNYVFNKKYLPLK